MIGLLRSDAEGPDHLGPSSNAKNAVRPTEPRVTAWKEARAQVGPKVNTGD